MNSYSLFQFPSLFKDKDSVNKSCTKLTKNLS